MNPPDTVLVVDDTPASLAVVCDTLAAAAIRVLVAETGRRALELFDRDRVDLVLLDVRMPGLDGFGVCAQLRTLPGARDVPVIFLTSVDEPDQKVRAFAAGAVDYVNKPVHPPEMLARVRTHLALRTARLELQRQNEALAAEIAVRLDAEAQLAASLDRALVVVESEGRLLFQSSLAADLLQRHLTAYLPETLPSILHDAEADATMIPGLRVRRFTRRGTDDPVVYFIEEVEGTGPGCLMQLGLTPREAEVLYWIAEGKTNPEIAIILGAARRTISTHVEHILAKLGVENRAGAVMVAAGILPLASGK